MGMGMGTMPPQEVLLCSNNAVFSNSVQIQALYKKTLGGVNPSLYHLGLGKTGRRLYVGGE